MEVELIALTDKKPMSGLLVREIPSEPSHTFSFEGFELEISLPPSQLPQLKWSEHGEPSGDADWVPGSEWLSDGTPLWAPAYMNVTASGDLKSLELGVLPRSQKTKGTWWQDLDGPDRRNVRDAFIRAIDLGFEYWLRVVRWQLESPSTGRLFHDISTYVPPLRVAHTGKSLGDGSFFVTFLYHSEVNARTWSEVGTLVRQGLEPPLALEYYLDGVHQLRIADIRRAVLDLAVAAEVHLKSEVMRALPKGVKPEMLKAISGMQTWKFRDKFFRENLAADSREQYEFSRPALRNLAEDRNKLMHGQRIDTPPEVCKEYADAVLMLLRLQVEPLPIRRS